MKAHILFLIFSISLVACTQKRQEQAEIEKEYIENLEEKNRILERELKALKEGEGFNDNDEPTKPSGPMVSKKVGTKAPSSYTTKASSSHNTSYFTMGSSEEEVLDVMGDPTSITVYNSNWKVFHYSISSVEFKNGRVYSYSNLDDKLKVRVRR
jgi:hypothetical protein